MATAFETTHCSRCHGTGRHSFNGEHSICYKCDGRNGGRAYTPRGRAAKDFYLALRRLPATVIEPGQKVRGPYIKQLTVATIERRTSRMVVKINGVEQPPVEMIRFTNAAGLVMEVASSDSVDIIPTEEQNADMIAQALAYQATLTKAGSPRKKGPK